MNTHIAQTQQEDMMTAVAFRLTANEHDALMHAQKNGFPVSTTLRSLLVTHLLRRLERLTSVTFRGGYRAERSGSGPTWQVVHKGHAVLLRGLDRDEAIVRCEWIAEAAVVAIQAARASRRVGFRLSFDEYAGLMDLAKANKTTVSAALRSFVVTRLMRREQRLVEVSFINGYRAYLDRSGWSVGTADKVIARNLSREDALQRADWLSQASPPAAS